MKQVSDAWPALRENEIDALQVEHRAVQEEIFFEAPITVQT